MFAYRYTSLTTQSTKGSRFLSSNNGSLLFDSMNSSSSSCAHFKASGWSTIRRKNVYREDSDCVAPQLLSHLEIVFSAIPSRTQLHIKLTRVTKLSLSHGFWLTEESDDPKRRNIFFFLGVLHFFSVQIFQECWYHCFPWNSKFLGPKVNKSIFTWEWWLTLSFLTSEIISWKTSMTRALPSANRRGKLRPGNHAGMKRTAKHYCDADYINIC